MSNNQPSLNRLFAAQFPLTQPAAPADEWLVVDIADLARKERQQLRAYARCVLRCIGAEEDEIEG